MAALARTSEYEASMETIPRAGVGAVAGGAEGSLPVTVFGIALGVLLAALVLWAFSDSHFWGKGR